MFKKLVMFLFFWVYPMTNQLAVACQVNHSLSTVLLECLLDCLSHLARAELYKLLGCSFASMAIHGKSAHIPLQNTTINTSLKVQSSDPTPMMSCGASGGGSLTENVLQLFYKTFPHFCDQLSLYDPSLQHR